MNMSSAALKLLGDMLTELDERDVADEELEALQELCELFKSLM